ncbi:MAG: PA2779 family protein [Acidiferrobacteraceae bacterium]
MQKLLEVMARPVGMVLICSMMLLGVSSATASAAMVTTGTLLRSDQVRSDRQKVLNFLERTQVQQQMERLGVAPSEARARVAALSASQVHQLAGRIQTLPAGGDILEVALLVFIILLITDILGFTDIFPFVHHHIRLRGEH